MQTGAKKAETALGGLKKAALAIGIVLGGQQVLGGLRASLVEFTKHEAAYKRVEVRVKSLGLSYKTLAPEIRRTVEAQSALAKVADIEIVDAFNRLLTTTGDYEQSLENLPLVLDIVAAGMADVGGAATIMNRILSGSTQELRQFNGLAEAMGKHTDKAERAKAGVAFMSGRFGGTAAATAGDTLESAQSGFKDAVVDFKVAVGEMFAPGAKEFAIAMESVTRFFTPGRAREPGEPAPKVYQGVTDEEALREAYSRKFGTYGPPAPPPGPSTDQLERIARATETLAGWNQGIGLQGPGIPLTGQQIRGGMGGGLTPMPILGGPDLDLVGEMYVQDQAATSRAEEAARNAAKVQADAYVTEMERVQQQLAAQFGSAIGQGMVDLLSGDGKRFVDGIANMFKRSLAQILGDLVTSGLTGNPYGLAKAFLK